MSFLVRVNDSFQDYLNREYEYSKKAHLFYVVPVLKLISTIWMIMLINYIINSDIAFIANIFLVIFYFLSAFILKINMGYYIKFLFVIGIIFPIIIVLPLLFSKEGPILWSFNIFSIKIAIYQLGFNSARDFLFRMLANTSIIAFFILSTPFTHIIHIFHQLRFPSIFITVITLTYRYFFLFFENLIKILRADDCRRFEKYSFKKRFTHLGTIFSMLLLRSFRRGTKIHQAMLARGYNGDIPDINYKPKLMNTIFYLISMILLNTLIWILFM